MSTITRPPVKEALKHLETVCSEKELRLLAHKFGSVPGRAGLRIKQASEDELMRWALRVLDVERIEDVFA